MGLVTLNEFKEYVGKGKTDTKDDTKITTIIDQVSTMVETYCNRTFTATDYEEYHDGGKTSIFLDNFPIVSVSSVSEYDGDDYVLLGNPDPTTGKHLKVYGTSHTATAYGNTHISTRTAKFGDCSAKFDGTGDYISVADSGDFHFSTEPFCVEAQVRFNSLTGAHTIASQATDSSNYWALEVNFTDSVGLKFTQVVNGNTTLLVSEGSIANYTVGAFYHVALSRDKNNFRIFSANTLIGSGSSTVELPNYTGAFNIGRNSGGSNNYINGYMDEVRVSWDSRYTATFTALTQASATDAKTKLLLHMTGPESSNTFTDDSRNVNDYTFNTNTGEINKETAVKVKKLTLLGFDNFNNYPNGVKVLYKGGYATIPNDVKNVVLELTKMYNKGFEGIASASLRGESFRLADTTKDGFPPHIRRVLNMYKVFK